MMVAAFSSASFASICISSTGGGGGKTLLALGLGRLLRRMGYVAQPFKKGPDYIDAAWLSLACGLPATNLDPFFLAPHELKQLMRATMAKAISAQPDMAAIALLEGNRGLYDGLDDLGSCSTAAVARAVDAPILLCVNCAKTTRTMAAILQGLINFEENVRFCGVILNRVASVRHEQVLVRNIEKYTDLPVLGALPRLPDNPLPERHMGLACACGDVHDPAGEIIDHLADLTRQHCSVERILEVARPCNPEETWLDGIDNRENEEISPVVDIVSHAPVIGYVRDPALWFYYPENLEALREAGARLLRLSLLDGRDDHLWDEIDGLYLGGGFPEDYAREISDSPYLAEIASLAAANLPIYAECGGLMILCSRLRMPDGTWPMASVFDAEIEWLPRPQGLGYVEGRIIANNPYFPTGLEIRGHEFHYSRACYYGTNPQFGMEIRRGSGLCLDKNLGRRLDGLIYKNVWGSYTHIFAPALACWAPNFARAASSWHASASGGTGNGRMA